MDWGFGIQDPGPGTRDLGKSTTATLIFCADKRLLDRVDKMLAEDIAKLMAMVPLEEAQGKSEGTDRYPLPS
jgi:hypothetical protein